MALLGVVTIPATATTHPPTDSWYEDDDSIVREVDRQTVLNSEAYVLFYRKESPGRPFNF